jgi:hypothetical protein
MYFSVPVFVNAFFLHGRNGANIKFLAKLRKSGREILEMLETEWRFRHEV